MHIICQDSNIGFYDLKAPLFIVGSNKKKNVIFQHFAIFYIVFGYFFKVETIPS